MPASKNDWFTKLTGFSERTPAEVRHNITVNDDGRLTSKVNGQSYQAGRLQVASLGELRQAVAAVSAREGRLKLEELVGDAQALHTAPANAGAMFQVASQFNLLEMVSPRVTPEEGVGIYEHDRTQGPACAIACGAGTIFRNYFVPLGSQIGQSQSCQVDCLREFAAALGSADQPWWQMRNGYALPSAASLQTINEMLEGLNEQQLDALRAALRVGIQWNTQVTLADCQHLVSQVYCSAMPVAYSGLSSSQWQRLARLILEAAYEATLAAAMLNAQQTGNSTVYLTLLGGGAFGNPPEWILSAIERACRLYQQADLNVKIVSYRSSNPAIQQLVHRLTRPSEVAPTNRSRKPAEQLPDHHCPVCGVPQSPFLRYPWYVCNDCLSLAECGDGRRLRFGNTSPLGGFCFSYADDTSHRHQPCTAVVCLIHGRPVLVTEARFGGVVAQPLCSLPLGAPRPPGSIDLTRATLDGDRPPIY